MKEEHKEGKMGAKTREEQAIISEDISSKRAGNGGLIMCWVFICSRVNIG